MKRFSLVATLVALVALGACSNPSPQVLQAETVACAVDGAVQPVAATVLAAAVPQATPGVAVDNLLVHPAVVAYCKSVGGTPVAQVTAVVTAVAPAIAPAVQAVTAPAAK